MRRVLIILFISIALFGFRRITDLNALPVRDMSFINKLFVGNEVFRMVATGTCPSGWQYKDPDDATWKCMVKPTISVEGAASTEQYTTISSNTALTAANTTFEGVTIGASKIIEGYIFENFTNNQNGHALFLQNITGATVRYCLFTGTSITNSDVSGNRGLVFQFGGPNTIEKNLFINCRGSVYVLSSTSGGNLVQDNWFLNTTGPYSAGQFIAFNHNSGDGSGQNIIRRNKGANFYGESYAEDMISINLSSGTATNRLLCEDNIFMGTGPSASGGGIVCGEGGGDYVTIQDNKILEPGNYSFAISVFNSAGNAGSFNVLLNNQSYQSSKPWDNNGLIVWGQSGVAADCNVQGNEITVSGGDPDFFDNYTVLSGGAVNAPTSITLEDLAFPALEDLIDCITLDEIYILRAANRDVWMAHIIFWADDQDALAQDLIERPTANSEADNTVTTTSTTLTNTSAAAASNVISDYLWEIVSYPGGASPALSAATSSTTDITGMTVSGDYRVRHRVRQENYVDINSAYDAFTEDWDWTTITANVTSDPPYPTGVKRPAKYAVIKNFINYKHNWIASR